MNRNREHDCSSARAQARGNKILNCSGMIMGHLQCIQPAVSRLPTRDGSLRFNPGHETWQIGAFGQQPTGRDARR